MVNRAEIMGSCNLMSHSLDSDSFLKRCYDGSSNYLSIIVNSAWSQARVCVCVLVAQSCPTLCDPMDCSPPGSSVHGILQESTEVDKRMHVGIILLEKIRVFFFLLLLCSIIESRLYNIVPRQYASNKIKKYMI